MLKHHDLSRGSPMNVPTRTISMVANKHNLILDVPRDNTNGVPNRRNLCVDYESDG
jgi:hypothetical protein